MRAKESRKKKSRFRYRKAAVIITLLILVIVPLTANVSASKTAQFDKSKIEEYGNPDAAEPNLRAASAILYSIDLEKPLYEKNADKQMAPYSITKLMTNYLALENLNPGKVVKISKNATRELKDGMEVELDPGDEMTALDLIHASMMMSANDASIAIGEATAGSEKKFIKMMNDQAKDWGCEHTHFVNTNGWDHKDHYTTARDMAIITEKTLENDTLREISMKEKFTIEYLNKDDDLFMINAFLKTTEGVKGLTGGKTGTWSETESTIALEFSKLGQEGVIVLLGDNQKKRAEDVQKLIEYAHEKAEGFAVTQKGEASFEAKVKGGAKTDLPIYAKKTTYAYPKSGKVGDIEVTTDVKDLEAPISKGQKLGNFEVAANGRVVEKGYLYAANDVKSGMFFSKYYVPDHVTWLIIAFVLLLNLQGFIMDKRASKES